MKTKNEYLKILEFDLTIKDPSDSDIKQQYRKLSLIYHSDNQITGNEAKFREITEAKNALIDKKYEEDPKSKAEFVDIANTKIMDFLNYVGENIKFDKKTKLICVKLDDKQILTFDVSNLTKNKHFFINGRVFNFFHK